MWAPKGGNILGGGGLPKRTENKCVGVAAIVKQVARGPFDKGRERGSWRSLGSLYLCVLAAVFISTPDDRE